MDRFVVGVHVHVLSEHADTDKQDSREKMHSWPQVFWSFGVQIQISIKLTTFLTHSIECSFGYRKFGRSKPAPIVRTANSRSSRLTVCVFIHHTCSCWPEARWLTVRGCRRCIGMSQKTIYLSSECKFYKDGQVTYEAKKSLGCLSVCWEFRFGQLNVKYLRYVENVIRHDAVTYAFKNDRFK